MKKEKKLIRTVVDERNLARLGVVSIQTRVPSSADRWGHAFTIGDRHVRIEGNAPEGRPRGIDTNVLLGIETLFAAAGCPEHNWLHTNGYELREASFLPDNGNNYRRLRESINRLYAVYFTVASGLSGSNLRHNESMRILDRMQYWDVGETDAIRELVPEANLGLKLADQFAESIRSGFTQALDGRILLGIEQPPARALYRLLEAYRYTDDGRQLGELTVELEDWRLACGISPGYPNKLLRALGEAHDELVEQRYLRDVRVTGTRSEPLLTYVFAGKDDPDPALVRLLRARGVSSQMANKLARETPDRVEEAIKFVEYQKRQPSGVKREAAVIVDYLTHPGKYLWEQPEVIKPADDDIRVERSRQRVLAEEDAAAREAERAAEELLAAPPEVQWRSVQASLKVMLKMPGHLTTREWERLEQLCLRGERSAVRLRRELAAASASMSLQSYIEELRSDLR
ncbi:replication initiator protein A [Deinococcus pimensis]|uniref:replication initiator protein A n=1 Tax=Deinococcus pimensis TaxID=309888 RepID=UPI00047F7FA9|nr:replication initiator protein A [Deinococcus pimensis]